MEDEKKKEKKGKVLDIKDVTICDATAQMLEKAEKDGVETAFHRAASMKASERSKHVGVGAIVAVGSSAAHPAAATRTAP